MINSDSVKETSFRINYRIIYLFPILPGGVQIDLTYPVNSSVPPKGILAIHAIKQETKHR